MNKRDTNKIIMARSFAVWAHGNQEYNGKPYVTHLDDVVLRLGAVTKDAEELLMNDNLTVTAFLHDVLEDTDVRADTIASVFGADVVYWVSILTRIEEEETYEEYIDRIIKARSRICTLVKLADLESNIMAFLRGGHNKKPSLKARYEKAYARLSNAVPL